MVVTSADVTGRPVGKRVSVDVFRRIVHEGIPLSSCVLGWTSTSGHGAGVHGPSHWLARRPARAGSRDPPAGGVAGAHGDLPRRLRRDGFDELAPVAPRTILRRQVERLTDAGLTPQVASELEFSLYHGSYDDGRMNGYETLVPTTLARADYTIQAGDRYEGFFSGVRDALAASELGPWTSQVEWVAASGRSTRVPERARRWPTGTCCSSSRCAPSRRMRGWPVTFMARPFADTTGSSCHLHLSLVDGDGRNVFHDAEDADGISATLRHAIGGVLERAPELMLFYAPTVNSYRRTTSGEFSGNGLSWGFDSRMVSCRVLTESPESTRLGACPAPTSTRTSRSRRLASALDGIETQSDPGEPLMGSDFERPVTPLPASLGEAVERFRDGPFAPEVLARTWSPTTRRPDGGSGSSSCPPRPWASGSDGATSTSSEEVVMARRRRADRTGRTRRDRGPSRDPPASGVREAGPVGGADDDRARPRERWHHHGGHDTIVYVISGHVAIEFGEVVGGPSRPAPATSW